MPHGFEPKRLDDMGFDEISRRYAAFFKEIIGEKKFQEILNSNKLKYERMTAAVKKGLKFTGGTMGRADLQYGRNMLYGWFLEELILFVVRKNCQVETAEFFGEDKEHDFVEEEGKIRILGKKSTEPDYLALLPNDKRLFLELKSAAKNVYSIKKGNVKNLTRSFVDHSIPTTILMIDLNTGKYEIKGIGFFKGKKPFVNQRMEGQLCYDFPEPSKPMQEFPAENLTQLVVESETELRGDTYWKGYRLLKKAREVGARNLEKAIIDKIRIEELEAKKRIQSRTLEERINKIKKRRKKACLSWEEIERELRKL